MSPVQHQGTLVTSKNDNQTPRKYKKEVAFIAADSSKMLERGKKMIDPVTGERSILQNGDGHTVRYVYKKEGPDDQQVLDYIEFNFTAKVGSPESREISEISFEKVDEKYKNTSSSQ